MNLQELKERREKLTKSNIMFWFAYHGIRLNIKLEHPEGVNIDELPEMKELRRQRDLVQYDYCQALNKLNQKIEKVENGDFENWN